MVQRCRYCLLLLLIALSVVSASLPHNNYLHLVEKHRRLTDSQLPRATSVCGGKNAGDPIEGQYILVFDPAKVETVSEGVSEVRKALQQRPAVRPTDAAVFPPDTSQPATPADPFSIIQTLTTVSELGGSTQGRRLQQSRARRPSPILGAVVRVPEGAEGVALVQSMREVDVVQTAVQDVCVKALDSQERFSCLPTTMLSSSIQQPIATATWDGCLTPNTFLAWWGERCGSTLGQVQWNGVYAFDKTTGARLPNCIKQRPATGALPTDLAFWLGACGVPPPAVPTLSGRVCKDPYVAENIVTAEQQGCMSYNFTEATQTLQIFHPVAACGTNQPVNMTYRGQRCTGNNGANNNPSTAGGILWLSAEPSAGSGLDTAACSLQRRTGTAAEDAIYNMDWFGSCGVPPARVQYIPRSECPAPPPPPPPSPSPRPEDQKALDRVPLKTGETVTPGIRRVLAVTANVNSSSGYDTVQAMRPITVAVMDSGVDCFHRDLNVVFNISFVKPPGQDTNGDTKGCADNYNHGTNVAGIIGARNNGAGVVGVFPDVAIASLKILDSEGSGPVTNILAAATWLLQQSLDGVNENPDNATNAEVLGIEAINMSFGFPDNPYSSRGTITCQIMHALLDAGILVGAAAGNERTPLNQMLPAACAGVVAVTAMQQGNGTIDNTQNAAEWFSNFLNLDPNSPSPPTPNKANLTVSAPGEEIYSTCYQQQKEGPYCVRTGTSQATPHVVGMLARCLSGGRCRATGLDAAVYAVNKWYTFNQENKDYGYAKDPIRFSRSVFYWGYLTCADVW